MDKILYQDQKDYLKKLRKPDSPLINEMEDYARQHKVPILTWDAALFMEQLVLISAPKRVLEIGTAIAYTTVRIARNLGKKSEVHTIEKSQDNILLARDFISRSGEGDKITIFEGDAFDILPGFKKKYDLIFLDADKEDYSRLFKMSLKLLKKGGIVFVDNLLWHGYAAASKVPDSYKTSTKHIRDFNNEFINQKKFRTSILPIGDGIGLGINL